MSSDNLFADRYVLERLLGRGGMAEVHLARDIKFDRLVALKLFKQGHSNAPGRARFLREATVAGRLIHPNIVTVYDFGEHGDTVFISMEYIAGETLGDLVRHDKPETLREQLSLMVAICEGLAVAHDAGILHRDLKPDNLMITRGGTLKILDFGIARALSATGEVTFAGSPYYMSPEQLTMSALDVRSDVFAAGTVFYELLTFVRAFRGDDLEEISRHIRFGSPVPIRELRPDIEPRVIAIVERALEKDPDRRYPDVRAMQRELRAVLQTLPAEEDAPGLVPSGGAPDPSAVAETVAVTPAPAEILDVAAGGRPFARRRRTARLRMAGARGDCPHRGGGGDRRLRGHTRLAGVTRLCRVPRGCRTAAGGHRIRFETQLVAAVRDAAVRAVHPATYRGAAVPHQRVGLVGPGGAASQDSPDRPREGDGGALRDGARPADPAVVAVGTLALNMIDVREIGAALRGPGLVGMST